MVFKGFNTGCVFAQTQHFVVGRHFVYDSADGASYEDTFCTKFQFSFCLLV
jgi:hypothetical protein